LMMMFSSRKRIKQTSWLVLVLENRFVMSNMSFFGFMLEYGDVDVFMSWDQ
jgi:hypothetical protein